MGKVFSKGAGGGAIKSVQRGVATITGTSLQIVLSEIIKGNCIVKYGRLDGNIGTGGGIILGKVTTDTELHFERYNTNFSNVIIWWEVIEFDGVASSQEGEITFTSPSTQNIVLSAIDPDKSIIDYSARWGALSGSGNTDMWDDQYAGRIVDATNAEVRYYTVGSRTVKMYWKVITFK